MSMIKTTVAHTQNSVTVYTSDAEKEEIRDTAKKAGKSMSQYLLDLHKENIRPYSSAE